ncbi:alpha-D-ribose 1-methylphosphonate 5-triphosphate diphosphatase [Inquilinus limosus]|uniref:Phosphonate metabolism protein PhnM n=1 Tax=Inquilinus limosus TaxID=171674 RepID=A0A211ZPQ5_9PROT|nr:alpha-D-ribose 1-methylphosphonate 5-triphosphate diphosphatase [Inquilinus limosus]OWJ67240.1 phosphonate metabolism protein PhnM [Inquilinus limosus]
MPGDLIVAHARIVTAEAVLTGSLAVAGGRIADLDRDESLPPGAVDFEGDYLLPGLVELHTDHLERHYTPRPGVRWPAVTAVMAHDAQVAAAGITTVFDALALVGGRNGEDRLETLRPMVDGIRQAQAGSMLRAEHFLHLRCEVTEANVLQLFEPFRDDPLVQFMSVMDHAPGHRQFADLAKYREIYKGMLGMTDEQIDAQTAERIAASRTHGVTNRDALAAIGRGRGLPIASHDDETVAHVEEAAALGMVVSEFPTTLTAARAAREHGLQILMGAPNLVRGGSHSGNVSAGELAREGLVDILSSDYVPVSLLHGAFTLADGEHGIGLPQALATVTINPARAAGLEDRGRIEPGLRADLLRVRLVDGVPVIRAVWREGERVA